MFFAGKITCKKSVEKKNILRGVVRFGSPRGQRSWRVHDGHAFLFDESAGQQVSEPASQRLCAQSAILFLYYEKRGKLPAKPSCCESESYGFKGLTFCEALLPRGIAAAREQGRLRKCQYATSGPFEGPQTIKPLVLRDDAYQKTAPAPVEGGRGVAVESCGWRAV